MNSTRRIVAALGLAAVVALSTVAKAEAAPIVYVDPTPKIVGVDEFFFIDVWIKDLTESIGAFDVDLSFDDAILEGIDFSVDPDGNFVNDFSGALSFGFYAAGVVNIAESGDPAGTNLALGDFRLGTIEFRSAALGETVLDLSFIDISDVNGDQLLGVSGQNGVVCVVADPNAPGVVCPSQQVPEPGLIALLSLGMATVAGRRYSRRQQRR